MTPRVLIADDSLTVRMDLEEAFQEAGFETTLCSRLSEARRALSGETYCLIVLDIVFPDGNGIDLLKELRSSPSTATIPIIFLSTQSAVADRIRGLQAGAHDYAGKPYDRAYLVSRAKELVREGLRPGPEGGKNTVLIIEDSNTFREALKQALESAGYQVIESLSGEDGLRQAERYRPQAILVDGILPDIDGAMVIQRLRLDPALRGTPCILLTASLSQDEEIRALDAGADTYLRKDQGIGILLARIASVLRPDKALRSEVQQDSIFGPKKVLAVDDSETYLQELVAELCHDGYDVVMARSGNEALDLLSVQPVDCILMDLLMPGLSGQDTCRRIKQSPAWREIPIIILTAREDRETMLDGISAGADDFISKTSDFEVVRARVRAQLRRKHVEGENRYIRDELHKKEMEASQERAARKLAEHRAELLEELKVKTNHLQESEERLIRLVETIADAIIMLDGAGSITFANGAAAELLGFPREAIAGSSYNDPRWTATTPDGKPFRDEDLPFISVMRTKASVHGVEMSMIRADGRQIIVSTNAAPLRDATGEVAGVVASMSDITRRKEVERMKDEFVSTVSHELRTPLSSLRGFAELMLTRNFKPEKQREFLTIIHNESVRLANLINDFLDIQRMESGRQMYEFQSSKLETILRESVALFGEDAGRHELRLDVSESLPPVWADPARLRQVVSNLISNALKFSPGGTRVTVRVREEDGNVVTSVTDQGVGIAEDAKAKLFSKFFRAETAETRHVGGTGLGLALVKEIVEAHKGRVWVESAVGKGSTFFFSLPVARQPVEAPSLGGQPAKDGIDVLLIEDDQAFARLLCEHFEAKGFRVSSTAKGEEAMEIIRRLPPRLALVDIHLGGVIDGWDLLVAVKSDPDLRAIPILIISASDSINARGLAVGGADCLLKPISPEWLLQSIRRQLPSLSGKRVLVVDDDDAFRRQVRECLQAEESLLLIEARDGREALKRMAERMPDLLLLDLLMPEMDGFELLSRLRADKRAVNLPVLAITGKDLSAGYKAHLNRRMPILVRKTEASLEHIAQVAAGALKSRQDKPEMAYAPAGPPRLQGPFLRA